MHELGYTKDILTSVVLAAEGAGAHRVKSVYLTIGEVRDIVDDLFSGCFAHFSKGTIAEGSELFIDRIPLTVCCQQCGDIFDLDLQKTKIIVCPQCNSSDYVVNTGMEFYVDHIEVS